MTLGELLGQLYLATALVAYGRSQVDRTWLGMGLVVLGAAPIALYLHGLRLVLVGGLSSGSFTLACLLLGSVLLGQAVGLPRPIARRLGIGMKNRRWAFDAQLWQLRGEFADEITLAQADPEARADALARAELLNGRMRRLRAPDAAWARLQDDLISVDATAIRLLTSDPSAEAIDELNIAIAVVHGRWQDLRRDYKAEMQPLLDAGLPRRGEALFMATFGVSALVFASAGIREYVLGSLAVSSPTFWIDVVGPVVAGCAGVGYGVWLMVRR